MNKSELIHAVANATGLSKVDSAKSVSAVLDVISQSLAKDESVSLVGFGTFSVKERSARTGRNPQTGAAIEIAASKNLSFKAGKTLKDLVKSK